MPVEDHYKQSDMKIWVDKEKSKWKQQGMMVAGEGLVTNKKKLMGSMIMDDKSDKTQVITSKKSCVCAPTTHTGSFRCCLHRVSGGDHGQKPSSTSFYSNKNNALVSGGRGGGGGGSAAGGLGRGQTMRLSRFAKSACFGASQGDDRPGGETSISCS